MQARGYPPCNGGCGITALVSTILLGGRFLKQLQTLLLATAAATKCQIL
jgi:hypothetical protein